MPGPFPALPTFKGKALVTRLDLSGYRAANLLVFKIEIYEIRDMWTTYGIFRPDPAT